MLVCIGEDALALKALNTMAEMQAEIQGCHAGHVILGGDNPDACRFSVAKIQRKYSPTDCIGIGVCSEDHGVGAVILPIAEAAVLFIGFDSNVAVIRYDEVTSVATFPLPFLFHAFLDVRHGSRVLAVHELGIIAFETGGKQVWAYDAHDVITTYVRDHESLKVKLADGSNFCLDLIDGNRS